MFHLWVMEIAGQQASGSKQTSGSKQGHASVVRNKSPRQTFRTNIQNILMEQRAMAHNGNGSSLPDLERQAEASRMELSHTVDELQSRVTPDSLKRDAKEYAWQTGQEVLHTIGAKAQENPLGAVVVAAGLAFPLWRVVSSIPAPILLIGAGLAMSRRDAAVSGTNFAASRSGRSFGATAEETPPGLARSVGERATGFMEDTQYKAGVMGSRMADAAADKVDTAREMASDAAAAIAETTMEMSREAAVGLDRARGSMTEMMERHPLLVGGLAFAIGGLLASSLPVTRSENRLMGSASNAVKNRARDIGEEGVDAVKNAASAVYEDVTSQAREQGLTPDTARGAVKSAANQVGSIIERASAAVEGSGPTFTDGHSTNKQNTVKPESDNG